MALAISIWAQQMAEDRRREDRRREEDQRREEQRRREEEAKERRRSEEENVRREEWRVEMRQQLQMQMTLFAKLLGNDKGKE